MYKEIYSKTILGATLLVERHLYNCTCSYCDPRTYGEKKGWIGLWLPEDKAKNSWRIVWWKSGLNTSYLRWTLPKLRIKNGDVCFKCHKKFGWNEARVRESNASNVESWHLECYGN